METCAECVDEILRRCASVRVLCTSREALGVSGERVVTLRGLPFPAGRADADLGSVAGFPAVRLFDERARAAAATFALSGRNVGTIARICERLDGLPLAIELAAANVRAFTPEQILANLSDRFGMLSGGHRTMEPHQRTLRKTLDWSYSLLLQPERVLLRRIAVFHGGCSLEACELVCAGQIGEGSPSLLPPSEIPETLSGIVNKSLAEARDANGQRRYQMLSMVRQYATELLLEAGEDEPMRLRHRDWCLALAESSEPALYGHGQTEALDSLEREHENLRWALACAVEKGETDIALRFGAALWWYWSVRGYVTEGADLLVRALEQNRGEQNRTRAWALVGAACLVWFLGDLTRTGTLGREAERSCQRLGDRRGEGFAKIALALAAGSRGEISAAQAFSRHAIESFTETADTWGMINAVRLLGNYTAAAGIELPEAMSMLEQALKLAREAGDKVNTNWLLHDVASLARSLGDFARAERLIRESLAVSREVGNTWGVAQSLELSGWVAYDRGLDSAAEDGFAHAAELFHQLGVLARVAACIGALGLVSRRTEESRRAVMLLGASEGLRRRLGVESAGAVVLECAGSLRTEIGEEAFGLAWEAGRSMSFDRAIRYAQRRAGAESPGA